MAEELAVTGRVAKAVQLSFVGRKFWIDRIDYFAAFLPTLSDMNRFLTMRVPGRLATDFRGRIFQTSPRK